MIWEELKKWAKVWVVLIGKVKCDWYRVLNVKVGEIEVGIRVIYFVVKIRVKIEKCFLNYAVINKWFEKEVEANIHGLIE